MAWEGDKREMGREEIPDEGVDGNQVDFIQGLDGSADLTLVGLDVADEGEGVVLLNLLHGGLRAQRVLDDGVLVQSGGTGRRLALLVFGVALKTGDDERRGSKGRENENNTHTQRRTKVSTRGKQDQASRKLAGQEQPLETTGKRKQKETNRRVLGLRKCTEVRTLEADLALTPFFTALAAPLAWKHTHTHTRKKRHEKYD